MKKYFIVLTDKGKRYQPYKSFEENVRYIWRIVHIYDFEPTYKVTLGEIVDIISLFEKYTYEIKEVE